MTTKVFSINIQKPTIDEFIAFLTTIKAHCDEVGKVGYIDAIDHFNCEDLCVEQAVAIEHSHRIEITMNAGVQK